MLNKVTPLDQQVKILKRSRQAIKVRRTALGLANRIPIWTLENARRRNSSIQDLRRNINGIFEVLISCPAQTVSCRFVSPRWLQIAHALRGNGICMACAQYKGGSINPEGYRKISVNGKRIFEHRHVMEKMLGRKLFFGETVHHGPGGRTDNRPKNLELRAPGKHKQGWSIKEMRAYLLTIPKKMGGLK